MMLNAFSVDVEDWYQSSHDYNSPLSDRCVYNTRMVLSFLDNYEIKGTFFVQGMVAKAFPGLVKEIDSKGHEIQSHAFSHRPINKMTPRQFYEELVETSSRIEDITGKSVVGFRAPDFSIDRASWWAFDVMAEAGIEYDSSIFPMKTFRYGVNGYQRGYSVITTQSGIIEELTVSVHQIFRQIMLPIGGGGYFRLFPGVILRYALNRFEDIEMPFVVYCHPYEFNPQEWKYMLTYIPRLKKLYQGIGRKKYRNKLAGLFDKKKFGTMAQVLSDCRLRCKEG